MLTIEEIKKRKIEGKRKWGSSLILLLQDKLDEDLPIDAITQYLEDTYNFSLKVGDLYQLKSKYYTPVSKINSSIDLSNAEQCTSDIANVIIEQNSDAEKIYQAIYKTGTHKKAFDLGKDF